MKKLTTLVLILGLAVFMIFACSTVDKNIVEPETNASGYDAGQNPAGFFNMTIAPSGGPFNRAPGMAVIQHDSIEARITCQFATVIDTNTIANAFSMANTNGANVALTFEWVISNTTLIYIRPSSYLNYNTTYVLTLDADSLFNIAGDMLDVDGDEIGGETPDDNTSYRFTTFRDDETTPGEIEPETDDVLPPYISGNIRYVADSDTVFIEYIDISLVLKIVDRYYDTDGSILRQELSSSIFDTTVILRDANTKTSVAGDISYSDTMLAFEPDSDLEAATDYEFVLKAQLIADDAGNKLNDTDDVIYTFTTTNSNYDGSIIVDDTTPPTCSFSDNGTTFTVTFSEEIDVSTINAATIVVTYNGQPNPGSFEIGTVASGGSPTGFATTVTFYPNDTDWNGTYVWVKASIRDLAGNRKGENDGYPW